MDADDYAHDSYVDNTTDWDAVTALGGYATKAQIIEYRKNHPSTD